MCLQFLSPKTRTQTVPSGHTPQDAGPLLSENTPAYSSMVAGFAGALIRKVVVAGSPLLAITVNCPDCQGVFPERQTTGTMLCIRGDGGGHQTAVAHRFPLVRRRLKRTPFTTRGVSHFACARYWPSAALHLHRQVLHCRRDGRCSGCLTAAQSWPRYPRWLPFPVRAAPP